MPETTDNKHYSGLRLILCALSLFLTTFLGAQSDTTHQTIQLSGIVSSYNNEDLTPIAAAVVYLKQRKKGVYTNDVGFFSIAASVHDTLLITKENYETFTLPLSGIDNTSSSKTIVVQMEKIIDTLPEISIYPWPSREFLDIEFLALEPYDSLHHLALKNLEKEVLDELLVAFTPDAYEIGTRELQTYARS